MEKSQDAAVNEFLRDMAQLNAEKHDILQKLREIVFETCPDASERMIYGGIMFTRAGDFGGIFASRNHVSFEFTNGFEFSDPDGLLEGKGKYRRHLKIRTLTDIEDKQVRGFVVQATEHAR
jgi:hypothetical protein